MAAIMRFECRLRGMKRGWRVVDDMVKSFTADPENYRLIADPIFGDDVEPTDRSDSWRPACGDVGRSTDNG
jgi:hypothetical protein